MATMRAVQVSRPNDPLELVERDIPEPGRGQVRVRLEAGGICHSDVFIKEGTFPGIRHPIVPGHEIAAIPDELAAMDAAPLLCAGVTTYNALRNSGARRSIQGWPSGTAMDSRDTLAFSKLAGVRPMVETMPLERAAEAFERMMNSKARFRMVLATSAEPPQTRPTRGTVRQNADMGTGP